MVDFTATWCGPCKMMAKEFDKLADKYDGKPIKYVKFDIDKDKEVARENGIRSLPTVKVYKDGEMVPALGFQGIKDCEKTLNEMTEKALKL